jgi:serine/threonine protein phosphatase PrpC
LPDARAADRSSDSSFLLQSATVSDVGRVREKNEDSALTVADRGVYVVADGMGGHNSGEIASQISVDAIGAFFENDSTDSMLKRAFDSYRRRRTAGQRRRTFDEFRLWKALEAANLHIFNTAKRYSQFRDMGTTVVATHFVGNRVYIGYVGDSRVYRIRQGRITQLTEDHSLANEYVKMKILRKEDLPRFPYKNVIVRALGLADSVKIDTFYKQSRADDRFLLCSDGLTDLVSDEDICKIMLDASDPQAACQALVDEANERGGVDNTTVLIVHVLGPETN